MARTAAVNAGPSAPVSAEAIFSDSRRPRIAWPSSPATSNRTLAFRTLDSSSAPTLFMRWLTSRTSVRVPSSFGPSRLSKPRVTRSVA